MPDTPNIEEHAKLAPSHADTWVNCAGSKNLEAMVPPDPEEDNNPHSLRGTAAHEGLWRCLTQNGYTPTFLIGKTMSNGVTLDVEDTNAIALAVDYVRDLQEHATKHRLPVSWFAEEKLDIGRYLGNREDIWGTADIQFFAGNTLEVIDYKHGYQHVEAEENLQLILYAIGAMAKAHDPKTKRVTLREVRLTIIQPRGKDQTTPIRTWIVEPDDLFPWAEKLALAAKATDAEDAPLVPGEKQCRWCRAAKANVCPAREQYLRQNLENAMTIPGSEAPPPTATPSWDAPLVTPSEALNAPHQVEPAPDAPFQWQALGDAMASDVELLSLETRIAILRQTDMLRGFLKDNEESLRKLAMSGTQVPGYKLVKALGNTAYKVPEEEIAKKVGNLKGKDDEGKQKKLVALDEYMPRRMISPTQLLKLVKTRVTQRVYENLVSLTHRPEGGPKLVPESSGGTPWRPPAEEMFQKQEAEQKEAPPQKPSYL